MALSLELEALNPWTASRFRGLAVREARSLLEVARPDGPVVAVGASVAGEPAGLVVARLRVGGGAFTLESLYVAREQRGRGVGGKLLRRLEDALVQRGVPSLRWFQAAEAAGGAEHERWLSDRGWTAETTLRVYECSGRVSREDWLQRARIPASLDVFRWGTLSARRRAAIERPLREAGWVPEAVGPWNFPELDSSTSLGVSRNGEVVGWMLTQPVSETQLRYAALCARPDVRPTGLGHQMLAEAIRRQVRAVGEDGTGIFTVSTENALMLRVVERRLKCHLLSSADVRVMSRALASETHQVHPHELDTSEPIGGVS
jgi:GNAT superfamily N-acetyltransferase